MKQLPIISLWQPWASLWASGQKQIETRAYPPRGITVPCDIAIHAAKHEAPATRDLCQQEPFKSALRAIGYEHWNQLPLGAVVGIVRLVEIFPTAELFPTGTRPITEPERSFGDYRAGRWCWRSTRHRLLAEPISLKGHQGIWHWKPGRPLKFIHGTLQKPAGPPDESGLFHS